MAFFSRALSVFIFVIASIAMLFSVFFSSRQEVENDFQIHFFEDFTTDGSNKYHHISQRESLYTDIVKNNFSVSRNNNSMNFRFNEKGRVLTSFYNPYNEYTLRFPGIKISQKGIGQVYIDTSSIENRYFVKPVSSIVELSFLSTDEDEVYNTIYLFPGQYIIFNPSRNSFYRNADLTRMQILTEIGYISEFDELSSRLEMYIGTDSAYAEYSRLLAQKKEYFLSKIREIRSSDINFYSGFSVLERHLNIFFNPEKRKLFYQNRVLESYIKLLTSTEFDRTQLNITNNNFKSLQQLDQDAYKETLEKIILYNSLMFRDTNPLHVPTSVSLAYVEERNDILPIEMLFLIFYTYNISDVLNQNSQSTTLTRNYIDSVFENYRGNIVALQYFSLLLQEKLLELLGSPTNTSNTYTLLYLTEYIRIARISFNNSSLERRSLLYIYQDVIELLEDYMRKKFFLPERTSTNLLVLNPQNRISDSDFQSLRRNIIDLLTYYSTYDNLLDANILRDVQLGESVRQKSRLLREYLSALANYESYILQYDTVSRELLGLGRGDTSVEITESDIRNYLSQFQGFGLASANIEIRDDGDARIERISLSGRTMSFTLSPGNSNRIREIVIDGETLNFEYPLDMIQLDWDDRIRTATDGERNRFDFARFFLNTFVDNRRDEVRDTLDENDRGVQEDRVIALFKRETLLGANGEFSALENIQFTFNNIIVTRVDTSFDISFDNVGVRIPIADSRGSRNIDGFFTGKYVFTESSGNFEEIEIQLYVDRERSERTIFGINRISVIGQINIDDFNNFINELGLYVQDIITMYNQIESRIGFQDISIQYNPQNKNVTIRFDFSGERNNIIYAEGRIQSYIRGRDRIISSPINPSQLERYLP